MFVVPSIIIGFILAFPTLDIIFQEIFLKKVGIEFDAVPTFAAIVQSLMVSIVIPILASVIPIRSATQKNLSDALDYSRSKTQAIFIKILDKNNDANSVTALSFCFISVMYGIGIYYLLPKGMLNLDLGLIL